MGNAYVLMTAMPPTVGHARLIEFASKVGYHTHIIVCTQPGEPFPEERYGAVREHFQNRPEIDFHRIHKTLPQEPEGHPGYWDMWLGFLTDFGLTSEDYIVASEMYGMKLAEISGAEFIPYDIKREIHPAKATLVRGHTPEYFEWILPEFQRYVQKRVTIFGAESTGKTTLARNLEHSDLLRGSAVYLPEWARPYLEDVNRVLDTDAMNAIFRGQMALQASPQPNSAYIIQDTDLFSTVGYWRMHVDTFGPVPMLLTGSAQRYKSDLYIITRSNIPFEEDPLRYGGDRRESSDQYWIDLADEFGLNYVILDSADLFLRLGEAMSVIGELDFGLGYDREGK